MGDDQIDTRSLSFEEKRLLIGKFLDLKKKVGSFSEYPRSESKTEGLATGYVSIRDSGRFMVKNYIENPVKGQGNKAFLPEKIGFLNEFVLGPLYELLLPRRAPTIGLISVRKSTQMQDSSSFGINDTEEDSQRAIVPAMLLNGDKSVLQLKSSTALKRTLTVRNFADLDLEKKYESESIELKENAEHSEQELALKSEFLENFMTLADFAKKHHLKSAGKRINLQGLKGVESLFAVILFLGEYDAHVRNVGVIETEEGLFLAKVDHGYSGVKSYHSVGVMFQGFQDMLFQYYDYECHDVGARIFDFNLREFRTAVEQILLFSQEQMLDIIRARVYLLQSQGLRFDDLKFLNMRNTIVHSIKDVVLAETVCNDGESVEKFYQDFIMNQRNLFEMLDNALCLLESMEVSNSEASFWSKGGWIAACSDKNVVIWAWVHDKRIQNHTIEEWSVLNGRPLWVEEKKLIQCYVKERNTLCQIAQAIGSLIVRVRGLNSKRSKANSEDLKKIGEKIIDCQARMLRLTDSKSEVIQRVFAMEKQHKNLRPLLGYLDELEQFMADRLKIGVGFGDVKAYEIKENEEALLIETQRKSKIN